MSIKRKVVPLMTAMMLAMTSMPTQIFAQEAQPLKLAAANEDVETSLSKKYEGKGYEVEFKVNDQWAEGYNGEIILTNTADMPLENWAVKFDLADEITNMWNAEMASHEGDHYVLKNMAWNHSVAPGSSIIIGFEASGTGVVQLPKAMKMLLSKKEVVSADCGVTFKVTSDWGQGFNGELSVTNNGDKAIEGWVLSFDFDKEIKSFWTAEIVSHEGEHYTIKNREYNGSIKPGETLVLGFDGEPGNVASEPQSYHLVQIVQGDPIEEEEGITLEEMEQLLQDALADRKEKVTFNYKGEIEEVQQMLDRLVAEEPNAQYKLSYTQNDDILAVEVSFTYRNRAEELAKSFREVIANKEKHIEFCSDMPQEEVQQVLEEVLTEEASSKVASYELACGESELGFEYIIDFVYKVPIQIEDDIEGVIRTAIANKAEKVTFNCEKSKEEVEAILNTILEEESSSEVVQHEVVAVPNETYLAVEISFGYKPPIEIETDIEGVFREAIANKQESVSFNCKETADEVKSLLDEILKEDASCEISTYLATRGEGEEYTSVKVTFSYVQIDTDVEGLIRAAIANKEEALNFNYVGTDILQRIQTEMTKVMDEEEENPVASYGFSCVPMDKYKEIGLRFNYVNIEKDIKNAIREGIANKETTIVFSCKESLEETLNALSEVLGEEVAGDVGQCHYSYVEHKTWLNMTLDMQYTAFVEDVEAAIRAGIAARQETVEFTCKETIEDVHELLTQIVGQDDEGIIADCSYVYGARGENLYINITFVYVGEVAEDVEQVIRDGIAEQLEVVHFVCENTLEEIGELIRKVMLEEASSGVADYTYYYKQYGKKLDIQLEIQYKGEAELLKASLGKALINREEQIELGYTGEPDEVATLIDQLMEEATSIVSGYQVIYEGEGTANISVTYKSSKEQDEAFVDPIKAATDAGKKEVEVRYFGTADEFIANMNRLIDKIWPIRTPRIDPAVQWEAELVDSTFGLQIRVHIIYQSEQEENGKEKLEEVQMELDNINDKVIDYNADQHQQFKKIFDYIVDNYEYDDTLTYRSLYDTLTHKTMVCAGYANLTYQLCKMAGIKALVVNNDEHAWNMVCLDGKWYHTDLTHADGMGKYKYTFYLLSTDEVSQFEYHDYNHEDYPVADTNYMDTIKGIDAYKDIYEAILNGSNMQKAYEAKGYLKAA